MRLKKYNIMSVIGISIVLFGCSGSLPEASSINCSGRGLEISLGEFKNDETGRQAFLDACEALAKD